MKKGREEEKKRRKGKEEKRERKEEKRKGKRRRGVGGTTWKDDFSFFLSLTNSLSLSFIFPFLSPDPVLFLSLVSRARLFLSVFRNAKK